MKNDARRVAIGFVAGGALYIFVLFGLGAHVILFGDWQCAMVKPATKAGERAECVVYVDVRVARQAQQQPPVGTPL